MTSVSGLAILIIFPVCMLLATFYDLFTMTIPNRVVLALIAAFAILAPVAGMGWETILWHIGIAATTLAVGFAMFSFGLMGGGDAKLLAATALWFGTAFTLPYLLIASIIGGVLTVLLVVLRRIKLPNFLSNVKWISRLHDRKTGIPYGAALGPAALVVFLATPWMEFVTSGKLLA